jgi:hypothetical protein
VPLTSSSRHQAFGAIALGYGVGSVVFDPDDDEPGADLPLRPVKPGETLELGDILIEKSAREAEATP